MEQKDLLIGGGQVFNAYLKQFIPADIVINNGRIFFVGDSTSLNLKYRQIVEAKDKQIIPGLIDIHMHIESSMVTPQAFAREVIRHGTTTIVSEPHEMANVFGIEGIREMLKAGEGASVDIYYGIPSSVPSTSIEFETTGAEIDLPEIVELAKNERVICLGEVMNWHDVVHEPTTKASRIVRFFRENYPDLPVEGHCTRLSGLELAKVLEAGITSDHTQQTAKSLAEKIQAGMFIELQEKSITRENIEYIVTNQLYEHIAFVTDDVMADRLIRDGHLNHLLKKAVELGMPVEAAIYCATYTPAKRMNLSDRGSLSPGKLADFIVIDDVQKFTIGAVYKRGAKVFDVTQPRIENETVPHFPAYFMQSIKRKPVTANDLQIKARQTSGIVRCRVIQVQDGTTATREMTGEVEVEDGWLDWEGSPYNLIAVLERYGKNGNIGLGLITGDTIQHGAVAASYAHDHHNIIAVGKNAADLATAINTVIERQGGYFVVENGQTIAGIELPIGGILSCKDLESVGRELSEVTSAMQRLGYQHYNPVMSLSTNGLPVSPLLKITDKGLIRFDQKKLVDIVVEE